MPSMKILLIAGGWSSEREVSLTGARGMQEALLKRGHAVTFFDLLENFDELLETARQHDFALINLHGSPGEDGLVQAMLEKAGCPYQGSGPSGSFLALNKAAAKQIFRMAGLPTADWEFLPVRPAEGWEPRLPWPLFVKTTTGGSSLRLGHATNRQELDALIQSYDASAVLREGVDEPVAGDYFDYESKYASGGARELCPAPVSPAVTAEVQRLALAAHKALGLKGYSRADFILGPDDSLHLLEVNTLPGMTPTSLVPQEAAQLGMDFGQLLEKLIELGMEQHAKA